MNALGVERRKLPQAGEWLLVGLLAAVLLAIGARQFYPNFLRGQLLPCAALALAPGCALRLIGRSSWQAHRFGLAAGLTLFMFANGAIDFAALRSAAARLDLLAICWLCIGLQPAVGALRWRALLAGQGISLRFGETWRLALVGVFFNQFIPGHTGGDLFRIYYVANASGRPESATASVICDRLLGLPPLIFLVALAAAANIDFLISTPQFRHYAMALAAGIAISATLILLLFWPSLRQPAAAQAESFWQRAQRAFAIYRGQVRLLFVALFWGFLGHLATFAASLAAGAAAGVQNIAWLRYALLVPMGLAVNAIPISPGGIGQGEMAFAELFYAASGLPGNLAAGTTVMLCLRLGQLLWGMAGGIIYASGRHALSAVSPSPAER